ncbi:hypothetical protein K7432_002523 [Basidiobolus ranarum]|uniref:Uncharacterized protein n=1 Tax=Basidiobolus ranarum TaxID=34480 RepID=A0ABR2X1F1_9FUNG
MEVYTMNASISPAVFQRNPHYTPPCNCNNMQRLSIESMEDLFDGATKTHTEETIPSQVPISLEQKLLDNHEINSRLYSFQALAKAMNSTVETDKKTKLSNNLATFLDSQIVNPDVISPQPNHVTYAGDTEPTIHSPLIISDHSKPLDSSPHSDGNTNTNTPISMPCLASAPSSLESPKSILMGAYQSDMSDLSSDNQESLLTPTTERSFASHIIIDKASIPGINIAPSAFFNNSYLTDTDDETNSQKSKEPMYSHTSSSLLSPQNPSNRRYSHSHSLPTSTSNSPRMSEIAGSKYIPYGRTKGRSPHDAKNVTQSDRSSRMSAIGEIVGGSMKYGFGKLLRKKRWQEDGKHSRDEGKWKYDHCRIR